MPSFTEIEASLSAITNQVASIQANVDALEQEPTLTAVLAGIAEIKAGIAEIKAMQEAEQIFAPGELTPGQRAMAKAGILAWLASLPA